MPPPHEQPPEPFFEPLPPPELHTEPERVYFQAPWQPPQNVMPVPVPISVELARTGDTVVALTGMEAYPAGVSYTVQVWLRPGTEPLDERGPYVPWVGEPRIGWLLEDGPGSAPPWTPSAALPTTSRRPLLSPASRGRAVWAAVSTRSRSPGCTRYPWVTGGGSSSSGSRAASRRRVSSSTPVLCTRQPPPQPVSSGSCPRCPRESMAGSRTHPCPEPSTRRRWPPSRTAPRRPRTRRRTVPDDWRGWSAAGVGSRVRPTANRTRPQAQDRPPLVANPALR